MEASPSYSVPWKRSRIVVGGDSVIENESIIATRSYTYNETLVLGKSAEESVLRESLAQDLARQVLRRIEIDRGSVAAVR